MLYDYKSKSLVQDVVLECFCQLVDDILKECYRLRYKEWISIFIPSYMGKELVDMLLDEYSELWIDEDFEMNLLDEDIDVLITIAATGNLNVETAKGLSGKFKKTCNSPLVYFYDGYSHKSLRDFDENTKILCFGFEDDFEDDYEDEGFLDLVIDEDGDIYGFRAYKETDGGFFGYEFFDNNGMDEDDIYETLRKIGMM